METFQNVLMKIGIFAGENKYLSSIKNAFQTFMPFIIAPLVTVIFGHVLTMLHICPVMYVDLPWTMPPLIITFLGSGGNIMGPVCQLLGIILSALVYLPFVKIYEKQQAQLTSE